MPQGLLPTPALDDPTGLASPQAVAEAFLAALAAGDSAAAGALIDDDIDYVNVGLPKVKGRGEMNRVCARRARPESGVEVYLHSISADGPTVLTERTDVIVIGPLRMQFWVWGRFDVHDGRITLWRDSFDFVDVLRGTVRGLVALAMPGVAPAVPTGADAAPGR